MLITLGEWCNPNCIYILFAEIIIYAVVLYCLAYWILGSIASIVQQWRGTTMLSKRHFVIVEIETKDEQEPKAVEDKVLTCLEWLKNSGAEEGFVFKSVGWIADNVREAPTGKQEV